MKSARITVMAAATGAIFAPVAFSAQFQFATGAEYSRGSYGELTSTEAVVVPLSFKLSVGHFSLRASVPYMGVRGPADISPVIEDGGGSDSSGSGSNSGSGSSGTSGSSGSGSSGSNTSGSNTSGSSSGGSSSGGTTTGGTTTTTTDVTTVFPANRDVHGFGDATISASWSFVDLWKTRLYLDVTGRVRVPTGDKARGLGTGTTDYAALAEMGWDGNKGGVFLSGGRRLLESTDVVERQDGWQASAGYWRNIGRRSVFGMAANWRTASIAGGVDPRSIDAYITRSLSTGWKLEVSGSAGLSQSAPDYVAGVRFIWRSKRR